jgi:hypothetical protein
MHNLIFATDECTYLGKNCPSKKLNRMFEYFKNKYYSDGQNLYDLRNLKDETKRSPERNIQQYNSKKISIIRKKPIVENIYDTKKGYYTGKIIKIISNTSAIVKIQKEIIRKRYIQEKYNDSPSITQRTIPHRKIYKLVYIENLDLTDKVDEEYITGVAINTGIYKFYKKRINRQQYKQPNEIKEPEPPNEFGEPEPPNEIKEPEPPNEFGEPEPLNRKKYYNRNTPYTFTNFKIIRKYKALNPMTKEEFKNYLENLKTPMVYFKKIIKKTKCKNCKGKGYVYAPPLHGRITREKHKCHFCKGLKYIKHISYKMIKLK